MKKLFVSGLLGALVASGAGAAITTPTLYQQHGYMNGYLNICFQKSTMDTSASVQVQTKPHGEPDSAYVLSFTQPYSKGADFPHNSYGGRYYLFATNLLGEIDVRVRLWKSDDDVSDWIVLDKQIKGYPLLKGTQIGTYASKQLAFDGNMFSICDGAGSIGYDFGEKKRIKGIRWFARPDNGSPGGGYGSSCFDRILNSTFDYANDSSFSDGVTILTCTAANKGGNTSPYQVNEYWLSEPITAQYIRYIKPNNGYGGLDEFEVIPWDCPYKPLASVARDDITNFWPVVTWTYQTGLAPTQVRVERGTAAAGPFTPVTDWMAAGSDGCFTNSAAFGEVTAPFVGVQYFYRVVAKTGNPDFIDGGVPQEVPSAVIAYRRCRRLDRAWGAETKLLSGASVMTATNGTYDVKYALAWDGKTGTFPDCNVPFAKGPVGLKFTTKTSVALFGYICRNDNYCFGRIKNTALYSAAAADTELVEKVMRSEYVDKATQDTTFYLQEATSIPEDGADCWFLYSTRNYQDGGYFGGNVAEVMFFGWNAQDIIDAGVVIAPKTVTFANTGDHLGVIVSWDEGANADDGYAVERRVRGSDDAWTVVAEVAAGVTSYTDTTMTQGYWEYRVTAKKGGETASSPAFSRAYYTPADGTGLKRIVHWPFSNTATSFTVTDRHEFADGAVDFDFANGSPICAGGPTERMFLACEGKLIVPFAGSYTITHETSDGGSVWIDGVSAGMHWSGVDKTTSSVFELTPGEHTLQVYTRIDNGAVNGRRKSILKWSGPVGEETIPACQLKPAADFYAFGAGPYCDYRQFGGNDWARASSADNVNFKVRGTTAKLGGRTSLNAACAMLKGKGARCEIEFQIARDEAAVNPNGTGGVILHEDNGNALLLYFDTNGGGGQCRARCRAITNGVDNLVFVADSPGVVSTYWYCHLRLAYDPGDDVYRGYHKQEKGDAWTQFCEFPNNGTLSPSAQVGFFAAGHEASSIHSGAFNIVLNKFRERKGLAIIVR